MGDKKEVKNKRPTVIWEKYKVEGDKVERNNKYCPKCGDGYLMAEHKDRVYCGKCHYTEMKGKDKE